MLPDTSQHRWDSSLEIKCIESAFKEATDKLLVDAADDVSFEDGEEHQRNSDTVYWVGFAFHYYIVLGMLTMVQKVQVNIQVTPVVFSSLKLEFQRRNKLI